MWRDSGYLLDILHAAQSIQAFTKDVSEAQFLQDELVQSGVIRQLEIIGEASGRISTTFVVNHPEIPWRQMIHTRNNLIHEYRKIKLDRIWRAVQVDIPRLIELLTPLVQPDEQ